MLGIRPNAANRPGGGLSRFWPGNAPVVAIDLRAESLTAARLLADETAEVAADWRQLCHWDPELPPDTEPPAPEPVIAALVDALRRPQPLGWGADPTVAAAIDAFTDRAGPLAIGELVCLREAVSRRLRGRVPADQREETWARLQMAIDRAMAHAARKAFVRLEEVASMDFLTGVGNRRSFERDLRREMGRNARHGAGFAVVVIDVDGLKVVNDTEGHAAGDARLRAVAGTVQRSVRREDTVYRIGGDEFAVLLPGATARQADRVMTRIAAASEFPFSWGASTSPADGPSAEGLVAAADRRLYRRRARRRGQLG
jgi:diguanylate cyclase (GGDEF)-like protein